MLYNVCERGFIFTNFITCSMQIYENNNSFTKDLAYFVEGHIVRNTLDIAI